MPTGEQGYLLLLKLKLIVMAINSITSVEKLRFENQSVNFRPSQIGKKADPNFINWRYNFYGTANCYGIFVAVIRGGQEHDKDRLSLLVLERYDCKERGVVFRWKDPVNAYGFGHEVPEKDGGWESAIAKGIKAYGGVVYHLSDPMVDMITLMQNCVQNNLSLQLAECNGFNYGRTPIQEKS
jgi:hypothetical protein